LHTIYIIVLKIEDQLLVCAKMQSKNWVSKFSHIFLWYV